MAGLVREPACAKCPAGNASLVGGARIGPQVPVEEQWSETRSQPLDDVPFQSSGTLWLSAAPRRGGDSDASTEVDLGAFAKNPLTLVPDTSQPSTWPAVAGAVGSAASHSTPRANRRPAFLIHGA